MTGAPVHVAVVGAGLAGWATALAAAEGGAQVTVVEKTPAVGGSTVLSGGFVALAGTAMQRAQGVQDTPERLEADLLEVGQQLNDPALVHAYAAGQADLVSWLADHGVELLDLELSSGQSVARSHRIDPVAEIDRLRAAAVGQGVRLRFDTPATGLIRADGRVVGVRCGREELLADTVVLASGGFSRSEELLARHAPAQASALRIGGDGCTGDGLRLGVDAGAALRDMDHVKGTFGTHPDVGTDRHELLLAYYLGALVVNRAGRRFVDESLSYKLLGDACLEQDGSVAFQVFDQRVLDESPAGVPLFDPRPLVERGLVTSADTITGLGEAIGVPAAVLEETVTSYNRGVREGGPLDPPRSGLVHGSGTPPALETPPFHAYLSTSVVLATYCGLAVDAEARVLDDSGAAIPGLRAVGEVTGGFHGAAYMTGSSLGKALHFGIVAGRAAAAPSREVGA